MTLTQSQIDSFNEFQRSGFMHPFTCGTKEQHKPKADDVLVAREDGLFCPSCGYAQFWAHSYMLDWGWKVAADQLFGTFRTP